MFSEISDSFNSFRVILLMLAIAVEPTGQKTRDPFNLLRDVGTKYGDCDVHGELKTPPIHLIHHWILT